MKKIILEWKYTALVFIGILVLGLTLRLINLTILPVFADEAIYIRWSQVMAHEPTLRFLPLSDGKQPLFMWILMFFVHRLPDPLFVGRLVSVFSGLGTIIGIFTLSYIIFKSKLVSLVGSLIWVIMPFSLLFDRMALVDSLLAMFGVWTVVFASLTSKLTRLDLAMITGFALGGALLTKSPAIFFVLMLPTAILFTKFSKHRPFHLIKLACLLGVIYLIGFAMYNILRLGPNFHLIGQRNIDYVWPITHIFESPFDPLKSHFQGSLIYLWEMGPAPIFALIILGIILNLKKNWQAILFLGMWGTIPIIINSEYAKVLTARYILFCIPFLIILAAGSFNTKKDLFKKLAFLFLGIYIISALWFDYLLLTTPEIAPLSRSERSGYLEEWTAGTGIKQVSEYLKLEHLKDPEKQIVVGTEGYFGTLPDGLQIYLEGIPKVVVVGVGLGIDKVHPSLVESKKAGNKTYLVANSSRLNFTKPFEESGLKIVASYKKANRPPALREWVQHGPYDTFYLFEVQ